MTTAPRRPRRAVRPPGTVGTDESVLRSTLPAAPDGAGRSPTPLSGAGRTDVRPVPPPPPPSGAARRAATDPSEDLWRAPRSADDTDQGWGREEPSSNDDRLQREKPPHW